MKQAVQSEVFQTYSLICRALQKAKGEGTTDRTFYEKIIIIQMLKSFKTLGSLERHRRSESLNDMFKSLLVTFNCFPQCKYTFERLWEGVVLSLFLRTREEKKEARGLREALKQFVAETRPISLYKSIIFSTKFFIWARTKPAFDCFTVFNHNTA